MTKGEQRLEVARQAVWKMLSIAEVLGSHGIDEATIRRAAPGLISAAAVRLCSTLASATLRQIEIISRLLAGGYTEEAIADIEAEINRRPAPRSGALALPAVAPLAIEPPAPAPEAAP